MGKKMTNPPKIFYVNWFRTDENDEFIWPGFGDNLRVLLWMLKRCKGEIDAQETALGYVPRPEDIDLTDLDITEEDMKKLLNIDKKTWQEEVKGLEEFYSQFDELPAEIEDSLTKLKQGLESM